MLFKSYCYPALGASGWWSYCRNLGRRGWSVRDTRCRLLLGARPKQAAKRQLMNSAEPVPFDAPVEGDLSHAINNLVRVSFRAVGEKTWARLDLGFADHAGIVT